MKCNTANVNFYQLTGNILLLFFLLSSLNFTVFYSDATSPYLLLLLVFVAMLVIEAARMYSGDIRQGSFRPNGVSLYLFIFWLLALVSTLAGYKFKSLIANQQFVLYLSYFPIYLISLQHFRKHTNAGRSMLLAAAYMSVPLLVQYWYIYFSEAMQYDGTGLMISANLQSIYLVISIFILLQFSVKHRWIDWFLIALYLITVIAIGSRSAILAIVIAALAVWLFCNRKYNRIRYLIVAFAIIVIIAGVLYTIRTESVRGRILLWGMGLSAIDLRHLVFGNGLGFIWGQLGELQSEFYQRRPLSDQLLAGDVRTILNEYIRMLLEIGAIGLVCAITAVYHSICKLKEHKKYYLAAALPALLSFSASSYPLASAPVCILTIVMLAYSASLSPQGVPRSANLLSETTAIRHIVLSIAVLTPILLLLYRTTIHGLALVKWRQLNSTLWVQYNEYRFHTSYRDLFKTLAHDPCFLSDYGTKLQSLGYYKEAAPILEAAADIQPSSQRLIQLGYNQRQLHEYDLAEASYEKASHILPKSFLPRYMLFDLYRGLHDKDRTKSVATEIAVLPVKIASDDVKAIKNEVIEYLKNNSYEEN